MKHRFLILSFMLCTALSALAKDQGTCGANLIWTLDNNGELIITGVGQMSDYSSAFDAPWSTYASSISRVTIGEHVSSIGDYAFACCKNLVSMVIPKNVTSVGKFVFGDNEIYSLTIGDGVKTIGTCGNNHPKKTIWMPEVPPTGYENLEGTINYVKNNSYGTEPKYKTYKNLRGNFEVDGIIYAVVDVPTRVCDAIDCSYNEKNANISILKTVTNEGVTLNVRNIQDYICYNNPNIGTLAIENAGEIGTAAFAGCVNLNSANLNIVGKIGESAFHGCENMSMCDLEGKITSIEDNAFYECRALKDIVLPNTVTSLGKNAFYGCKDLMHLTLGTGMVNLGNSCLNGCSSLYEITIPASVNQISDYAFEGCTSLTFVGIENRNTSLQLGSNGTSPLFSDCSLDSVYVGGRISYNTANAYGYSPFYHHGTLRAISFSDKEEQIYEKEFSGCTNLSNVVLGNGIRAIGSAAFYDCAKLRSIYMGSSMKSIAQDAFNGCKSLEYIECMSSTPPTCGKNALREFSMWKCRIKVPRSSLSRYKTAAQWQDFFFIEDGVVRATDSGEKQEKATKKSDFESLFGL